MPPDRDNWVLRAALAAAHTLTSSNGGYHPDNAVDAYEPPLSFGEMSFISAVHEFLAANGIYLCDETVENGSWLVLEEKYDGDFPAVVSIATLELFSLKQAKELALELRDEYVLNSEYEPNEGRATFLEDEETAPDHLWISATEPNGDEIIWRVVRLYEVGEPKPFTVTK